MSLLTSPGLNDTPSTSNQSVVGPAGSASAANVLAKGNAIVNAPAPAYGGQLTAGTSNLQNTAWQGLSNLTVPDALKEAGTGLNDIAGQQAGKSYAGIAQNFGADAAQQYMNPYLQQALAPQLEEARRQAAITQQANNAQAAQQGAFGGSRSAILEAENQRNLGTNLANITGQGYNAAYDKAATQFNADQTRNLQNTQFGATYGLTALQNAANTRQAQANAGNQAGQLGLQNLQALGTAGNTQQSQNQAGLNALYNQYLDQRNQPWTNLKNQSELVNTLGGKNTNTYSAQLSDAQKLAGVTGGAAAIMKNLKDAGLTDDKIGAFMKSMGMSTGTDTTGTAKLPGADASGTQLPATTVADMVDNGDGTMTYTYGDGHTEVVSSKTTNQ